MKTAVVVPTLNALRRGCWPEVLKAVNAQSVTPDLKVVVDSSSVDQTRELAVEYGWRVIRLARRRFNHGETRTRIVRALGKMGFDNVVFMSQDVVLASPDALRHLLAFLAENAIVGCYGKQLSRMEGGYNAWQRQLCYPNVSCTKSIGDVQRLRLRTIFFSNAFAAWKIGSVLALGGFPAAGFGEDMLLAETAISRGLSVGYCAQAMVFHDHGITMASMFGRGYVNGVFFTENENVLRKYGSASSCLDVRHMPFRITVLLAVKVWGFLLGCAVARARRFMVKCLR